MGWWPWSKQVRSAVRFIRAKFDSAQTTPENRRHWANADGLAADAAANPAVRRILRNRARYEVANNSYARGIVLTLANDVVGTGPRLQMLLGDGEDQVARGDSTVPGPNQIIEREFAAWAKAVDLAGKLRTMRMARAQDGEGFALLFTNASLAHPVQLDLRLIEADQVTTPGFAFGSAVAGPARVDGIVFDEFGNPQEYHVLKAHPGGQQMAVGLDYERVPSDSMVHWFRQDRPGQSRGLPDILPALPLFAQLRRYTLAVIAAAESAANIAIFMKTTAPAGGEAAEVEPMATMEFEPNMAVFGPEGWEPSQIKAEQPATGYGEFKHEILNEIARCLNMPFNVAACNSSGYNYASGRLDHQTYFKSIRVEQSHLETVILDHILDAWMAEAVKVFGLGAIESWPHQWFWDGHEHVDPAKEATAQATRLTNHTTTLAAEYARQGKDWETELRQRAKEVALMKELGLSLAEAAPKAPAADTQDEEDSGSQRAAA
jgi:lambda family phage portal protein